MAHCTRISAAENNKDGNAENRAVTETLNAALGLSSNSEECDGLAPSQRCIQGSSSLLSRNNGCGVDRRSGGSIQFPHWIPDSIIKCSSTRGHGVSEDALSVSHPEFLKPHSTAKKESSSDAAFSLNIRPPTELMDVKMKSVMPEGSRGQDLSENLVSEREAASFSLSGSTGLMKFNKSLSLGSLFTEHGQPICAQDSLKNTINFHHSTLLPNQHALFEMGTTTVRTKTVDSVEEIPEGYCRYSQATHNLFTTTKTDDVSLSKQNATFTSTVIEFSGHKSSRIQSLPTFVAQGSTGLKRKELSAHSSEGKKCLQHGGPPVVSENNESLAEGVNLNRGLLNDRKLYSGLRANSSGLRKGLKHSIPTPKKIEKKSSREIGIPRKKARSLDFNNGLLVIQAVGCSSGNNCQSSPGTRSNPESNPREDLESGPTNTWVRRLKQASSTSSNQCSISDNKVSMCSCSAPTRHCTEPTMNAESHSMPAEDGQEHSNNCKELLPSQSWIKRLQKDGCGPNSTPGEQQSSKQGPDELPKKQFPSIAAMALVGRAMNGIKSYEAERKGPLTLWYTKPS